MIGSLVMRCARRRVRVMNDLPLTYSSLWFPTASVTSLDLLARIHPVYQTAGIAIAPFPTRLAVISRMQPPRCMHAGTYSL